MRPIHVSIIAGLSVATLGVTQAEIEGEIHVGVNTEYIWRGVDQTAGNDAMVEAGVDLSTTLGGFDVSAGIWYASIDGESATGTAFDEVNYYFGVGKSYGCVDLEVGYIHYDFPTLSGTGTLGEVYFSAGTAFMGTDIAFTYYWDVKGDNNGYSELTVDKSFDLSECLSLDVGGTISYDWESGGDIHHYGLSTALNWAYNDVLTVSPYVSVTFAGDAIDTFQDDELFGGLILSAAF